MLLLRIQGDIKNVMKRGSHRASFPATRPTNTVVYVTFGNLRAQQISSIVVQCSVFFLHQVGLSLTVCLST